MKKIFNTKLTEIKNIGDELRFQREYFNFKNSTEKLTPKIYKGRKSIYLGDKLKEFLNEKFEYIQNKEYFDENKGEYGANETMLYDIEHNKIRASKEKECGKYNIDSYYLRIYSLFKIYGFLDDYEIIMLLYKYGINPKFKQSKIEIDKIKRRCFNEYKKNPKKGAFNLKKWILVIPVYIINELKDNNGKFIYTKKFIGNSITNKKITLQFLSLKKYMLDYFLGLSDIEKKYISLELGQATSFIDEILNGNIEYITLETLLKIVNNVEQLKNTDFEYIIKRDIEEQTEDNMIEIEKDIFGFRKKWGI